MELNNYMEPEKLLAEIVRIADDRKAKDIVAMRVTEQTTLADYFVIMTGTSTTHIKSLSDEGITSNWILMDYTTVVVNVFLSEAREMYALERMWGDAETVDVEKYLK